MRGRPSNGLDREQAEEYSLFKNGLDREQALEYSRWAALRRDCDLQYGVPYSLHEGNYLKGCFRPSVFSDYDL